MVLILKSQFNRKIQKSPKKRVKEQNRAIITPIFPYNHILTPIIPGV
jgi:hypothetical protein